MCNDTQKCTTWVKQRFITKPQASVEVEGINREPTVLRVPKISGTKAKASEHRLNKLTTKEPGARKTGADDQKNEPGAKAERVNKKRVNQEQVVRKYYMQLFI